MSQKNFQKKILSNGITLIHENRALPVVSAAIANKFGAANENSEIKGIAHVIEHLLFTGTKNRTHEDISRDIEKKGGILNAFTSHEITAYWFKLPSEHLFSGLDILSDMLINPKFDVEKFEKEKKVILEEIKMYHDNPKMSTYEQIEKNLFEKPFGELIIGNDKTVSNLKRDFVAKYFEEHYSPNNYIVSIVGNADFEKLCKYFEEKFPKKEIKLSEPEIKIKNFETTEERSGIDQAHLIFGVHAPLPKEKEFTALEVMDAYLANGMSSKLFLEIREKRGLAYSVKSSIDPGKNYCYYTIYVGTKKEAIKEVKEIILKEFKKIEEMTEKDLDLAKQRLIGLRQVSSEESINVMNELLYSELIDKAEEYYNQEEKINSISLEDVKKLAKKISSSYSTASIVPK